MKKFEVFGIKGLTSFSEIVMLDQPNIKLNTPTGKCTFK